MSKVTQTANSDSGATARSNWNEALKDVAFTEFEAGVVIDDDTMATATDTNLSTSEAIKAYIDNEITTAAATAPVTRSYSIGRVASGIDWLAGYYDAPVTDANLTQASTTQTLGGANVPYAARPFVVAGGAGTTDGSDLVLTITGTSITDAGVRTGADSEVVVADCTASALNQYYEPTKKWIGQVTYTLSSTGGATFSYDFNYGWAKYEDFGNNDFVVTDFEFVGRAFANDSGFNISLLLHSADGWTYSAGAFVPGNTVICDMNTDHVTEIDVDAGEYFAYKRSGLSQDVNGDGAEGVIVKIEQASNNTIDFGNCHIGVNLANGTIT